MTVLVVYESMFGNTRAIAEAVARGIGAGQVDLVEVGEASPRPEGYALVVVGGPTHAFGMSRTSSRDEARSKAADGHVVSEHGGLREWIDALPTQRQPVPLAVFDTKVQRPFTGSAAKRASKALRDKGFRLVCDPVSFGVGATIGPLDEGELARAEGWGRSLEATLG